MSETQSRTGLTVTIGSDLANVSSVIDAFREFLGARHVRDCLGLLIVLRELVLNAILYGNREKADLGVRCSLTDLGDNAYEVDVEDEGEGFDFRSVNMSLPENPCRLEHRGYALIRALADRIEFNAKGNRVAAYFTLSADKDGSPSD